MEFLTADFLGNVGFPVFVCLYTLFGIKPSLDKLSAATSALTDEIKERGEKQEQDIANLRDELREIKFKVHHLEVLKK